MDISKFLAKVIGIYLIIISVGMFVDTQQFIEQLRHLYHDDTLLFISGFFTLILGILMVVSHNVWTWSWRLLVTIIAWLSLCKGIILIFHPQYINKLTELFVNNMHVHYATIAFDFVLGLLFIYFGFRSHSD